MKVYLLYDVEIETIVEPLGEYERDNTEVRSVYPSLGAAMAGSGRTVGEWHRGPHTIGVAESYSTWEARRGGGTSILRIEEREVAHD